MLRFSIEDGPQRANVSAVYASSASLIPVSFLAVRLAGGLHPPDHVHARDGPQMTRTMFLAFCVCWLAITLLAYTFYRVEAAREAAGRELRDGEALTA